MEIKELGKVAFIDRITGRFDANTPEVRHFKEDCAVIPSGEGYTLVSVDLLSEGVHFDLTYTPLKHLGFKAVVVALSDICAMNGTATHLMIGLGISAKLSVEQIEQLYEGVETACKQYSVTFCGGDTTASVNGLTLALTAVGTVAKDRITYRSGAKPNDLICITGDLGAAYLGTRLLEREKRVLAGNEVSQPQLEGYEYPIGRALKPACRADVIESLKQEGIVPTSMMDISAGLASEMLYICRESDCGAKLFLDRIPIASSSFALADELKTDAVIAALNGGDDYELVFTVGVDQYDAVRKIPGVEVIGHMTASGTAAVLVTPDGAEIALRAQGWTAQTESND